VKKAEWNGGILALRCFHIEIEWHTVGSVCSVLAFMKPSEGKKRIAAALKPMVRSPGASETNSHVCSTPILGLASVSLP
jgi:hypothetical protein